MSDSKPNVVIYHSNPERLLEAGELIDELKVRLEARRNLVLAAIEARDLLKEIALMGKGVDDRESNRIYALLDAALKAYGQG